MGICGERHLVRLLLITEFSLGEGFGVATSSDAVHWHDHGYVWHGPSWTEHRWWEGTSSIWRAPDYNRTGRYLINYSEYPKGGKQTITFAESFDLIHWSRPSPLNTTYFPIDSSKGYKSPGRWDTIYTVPVPGKRPGEPARRLSPLRFLDGVSHSRHLGCGDHA